MSPNTKKLGRKLAKKKKKRLDHKKICLNDNMQPKYKLIYIYIYIYILYIYIYIYVCVCVCVCVCKEKEW